jgi:hypothetical protein
MVLVRVFSYKNFETGEVNSFQDIPEERVQAAIEEFQRQRPTVHIYEDGMAGDPLVQQDPAVVAHN